MIKELKGAIFDMDGTLVDSMSCWRDTGPKYLKKKGLESRPDIVEKIKTLSLAQSAEFLMREYGVSDPPEKIMDDINAIMEQSYKTEVTLKPGAEAFLHSLWEKGVPMCVATATDRHLVECVLARLDILKYFKGIVTCTEAGRGKDDPAVFRLALEIIGGARESTAVFEDALYAVKTAGEDGFFVAALFDQSAEGDWEEIKRLAPLSALSFSQLQKYF